MNGRTVGISIGVVVGLAAIGGGGYFGLKKLLARPPHAVVITYHRYTTALDNDERLAGVTARTLAMKSPRLLRVRSEATQDRVTVECSFDSKPAQYDDDNKTIANTTEQVLHAFDTVQPPPLVEDADPEARIWVLTKKDIYAQLDEIRGVTVWHGCGAPPPNRFWVRLDPRKLAAYKVDPIDFVLTFEAKAAEAGMQIQTLMDLPVKGSIKLSQVATGLGDPSPPPCTALTPNGDSVIALRVKLHPKTAPEDRGKFDAVIKDANATVIGEKDYSEVRFFPTSGTKYTSDATYAEETAVARSVLMQGGLPMIAVMMTKEGVGTLLVKRDAKDDAIHAFFAKTKGLMWGGIRGRRYLQVTVTDKERILAESRAEDLARKISRVEGIGQRITAAPTRLQLTYQVDTERARADNLDPNALLALVGPYAREDTSLPVVFDAPIDAIHAHGKPLSDYVATRVTPEVSRVVRINAVPAVELRWEISDSKPLRRVRQIVGVSPAATVDDVPASL